MRTRTRSNNVPFLTADMTDTFSDDPTPSRNWKEASHTTNKVVSFTAPTVMTCGYKLDAQTSPWTKYEYASHFPNNSWIVGLFQGWELDVLDSSPDPKLKAISINDEVMALSRSSTNLAEVLATMKGTADLFSRPGKFLKHARKHGVPISRRPLKELRHSLDTAGKTWLSGTYGYLPLISDLIELTSIARDPQKALSKLSKPRKKDIFHARSESSGSHPIVHGDYVCRVTRKRTVTVSRLIRIECNPNPTFQAMSVANQMATYLGLNDFGRLAWELVPYSFVFDWFSNLGKQCASASGLNGHLAYTNVRVSSWHKTTTNEVSTVLPPKTAKAEVDYPYYVGLKIEGGQAELENEVFYRTPAGEGNGDGDILFNGLDAIRTATGFALLLQRLKLPGW